MQNNNTAVSHRF